MIFAVWWQYTWTFLYMVFQLTIAHPQFVCRTSDHKCDHKMQTAGRVCEGGRKRNSNVFVLCRVSSFLQAAVQFSHADFN